MSSQTRRDLFSIDGREFDTPSGKLTARVMNEPDAAPSGGGISDQAWFILRFSDGKELTLVLSDAGLHHDLDYAYRARAFQLVQDWLLHGGPQKIEFYGT